MVQFLVNENSKEAKAFLEYIKVLPYVEFVEGKKTKAKDERKLNKKTLAAIQEIEDGKVVRAKSAKDLIAKLRA